MSINSLYAVSILPILVSTLTVSTHAPALYGREVLELQIGQHTECASGIVTCFSWPVQTLAGQMQELNQWPTVIVMQA